MKFWALVFELEEATAVTVWVMSPAPRREESMRRSLTNSSWMVRFLIERRREAGQRTLGNPSRGWIFNNSLATTTTSRKVPSTQAMIGVRKKASS
jgi:hypothetical protein